MCAGGLRYENETHLATVVELVQCLSIWEGSGDGLVDELAGEVCAGPRARVVRHLRIKFDFVNLYFAQVITFSQKIKEEENRI